MKGDKYKRNKWVQELTLNSPCKECGEEKEKHELESEEGEGIDHDYSGDSLEFTLKFFKGEEKDEMLDHVLYMEDGRIKKSVKEMNQYYLRHAVLNAPFSLSGRAWKDLKPGERAQVLNTTPDWIRGNVLDVCIEMNEGVSKKKD